MVWDCHPQGPRGSRDPTIEDRGAHGAPAPPHRAGGEPGHDFGDQRIGKGSPPRRERLHGEADERDAGSEPFCIAPRTLRATGVIREPRPVGPNTFVHRLCLLSTRGHSALYSRAVWLVRGADAELIQSPLPRPWGSALLGTKS